MWRAREGLPGAWVRAITQTPDGYLWIGTQGGLVRYGGGPLVPLPPDPAFDRGRDVMGLVANIGATVWLVPARGRPACVEGERLFDCFADAGTLPADARIADLNVDAAGVVWIAGARRRLPLGGQAAGAGARGLGLERGAPDRGPARRPGSACGWGRRAAFTSDRPPVLRPRALAPATASGRGHRAADRRHRPGRR